MKITAKDNDTQKRIKKWMNFYRWNQYQLKKNAELPSGTPQLHTVVSVKSPFGVYLIGDSA